MVGHHYYNGEILFSYWFLVIVEFVIKMGHKRGFWSLEEEEDEAACVIFDRLIRTLSS